LAGAVGEVPEFKTAGKLDFVILKKSFGKRYIKFEIYRTTKSPKEYVGFIWKSALLDSSWQVIENVLNSKEKVVDYLQLKYLAYENKNWKIDYSGNGIILKKEGSPKSGVSVKLTKTESKSPIEKPVENSTKLDLEADVDEESNMDDEVDSIDTDSDDEPNSVDNEEDNVDEQKIDDDDK
jgi:hypothetical protein